MFSLQHHCLGPVRDEYNSLIQRFKLAWNSCRSFLGDQGKEDVCCFAGDFEKGK